MYNIKPCVENELLHVLVKFRYLHPNKSYNLDYNDRKAIKQFLSYLPVENTSDCLKQKLISKKIGYQYEYKYLDLAKFCFNKYLCFSFIDQQLISFYAENGLAWRGDDIAQFKEIYVFHSK